MLTVLSKVTFSLPIILAVFISLSAQVHSAPALLNLDQTQKSKTKSKYIIGAHAVIKHDVSIDEVRFSILNAALNNKGVKWILEQDGDSYFVLRWDYGEAVIYSKVEFDDQYIQLKYFDASTGYKCLNNIEGICYRNRDSGYYGYMKQLRNAIKDLL